MDNIIKLLSVTITVLFTTAISINDSILTEQLFSIGLIVSLGILLPITIIAAPELDTQ